jgi:hypothetical protein
MSIAFGAAGTALYGGGDLSPAYPAGVTPMSEVLGLVIAKPSATTGGTCATPTGWTAQGSRVDAGGYASQLADQGNTSAWLFSKNVVTGAESGPPALTQTFDTGSINVNGAALMRLTKTGHATTSWAFASAEDTTAGNVSAVTGTIDLAPGDLLIFGMVIPTDVTTPAQFSAHTLTATGITFNAITEVVEFDTTSGNDLGGYLCHCTVNTGTATVAVTIAATAGGTTTNVRGPLFLLRARHDAVAAPSRPLRRNPIRHLIGR